MSDGYGRRCVGEDSGTAERGGDYRGSDESVMSMG